MASWFGINYYPSTVYLTNNGSSPEAPTVTNLTKQQASSPVEQLNIPPPQSHTSQKPQ